MQRLPTIVLLMFLSLGLTWGTLVADDQPRANDPVGKNEAGWEITAPPPELKVPAFYKKYISANGFPITASERVNDYALREAAYLVNEMLAHRPDVRKAMIASGSRLCIIGYNEYTTDLPEFANLGAQREFPTLSAKDFWDARARGTGGSQTDPYCSCGEENLLGYKGDPYSTECILIHEFAHNIHLRGMMRVDPTFDQRVKLAYEKAMSDGLWKGVYASVNHYEYFAEGVQSWFDNNRPPDHDHNHVDTRAELIEYDPGLAGLCREVFGETVLKYSLPAARLTGHLSGYDPAKAPKFEWPERLKQAKAEIRRQAEARNKNAQKKPDVDPPADATRPDRPETTGGPRLTLDRLFASREFDDEKLGMIQWSPRTATYFTLVKPAMGETGRDLVKVDIATGKSEVLIPAKSFVPAGQSQPLSLEGLQFSADESKLLIYTNSQRVWRQNTRGDYWLLDLASRDLKKLGGDAVASTMMFAKFSPDATRIGFVRDKNLYVQDLSNLQITPLTKDGSGSLINGTGDWVNEEELDIRDGFRWSPDGKSIAFWQFDTSGVREIHLITNPDGLYSRSIPIAYPKVGDQNSATRLGVVSATGGNVTWLKISGDPRQHYLPRMEWTLDSSKLLVQQFNRLQNQNHVLLVDPTTGDTTDVLTETDPAWLENDNPVRWVQQGQRFLWISERDGWRHAYLAGMTDQPLTPITTDGFDIIQVEAIDDANGWLYFAAAPDNPTQRYLYRAPLKGGKSERLTPDQSGWHTYQISPNAAWAIHTWSNFTTPPTIEIISLPDHKFVRTLIDNKTLRERIARLQQPKVEFLRIDIGKGILLDTWSLKPADLDPDSKYPLLFYVYGEPHGQTVRDVWMGTRGLWHWMLAQQGFIVASVDNHGVNTPRGRDWRKIVHRRIGILAPEEQAAATRSLLKLWPYVDARRIGIWGWSGGGSMSLMAILRFPDLYQTAIAVASNPWQLGYDTIYQERYMGLPDDNADNYRIGSPLTHAAQLKGNLLLVHGTGDDNCHYQSVELLMNELIAHGKHFDVMPYPARSHSISEGKNTVRHFYGRLTSYLEQHLQPKTSNSVRNVESTGTKEEPSVNVSKRGPASTIRKIEGWTVHVSDQLQAEQPMATDRAIELLTAQLKEIVRVVPRNAVDELKKVELWFSPEYPNVRPTAEYHPGADWLKSHGRDAAMAKGVEFTNIPRFEAETRRMPNFTLHELAHAYHDRVLSFNHPKVKVAFERAKASGKYDRVQRKDSEGRTTEDRAYALTNPMEYFAESTEAYFTRNDFFPFTQGELKEHDPEMLELLENLWGVQNPKSNPDNPVGK